MAELNLGGPEDYRVPDGGLLSPGPDELYLSTAALVLEVVSPGDESWEKLPFYAAHHVAEVLIVDPQQRLIDWLGLTGRDMPADRGMDSAYRAIARSRLIDLGPGELGLQIDWPADA